MNKDDLLRRKVAIEQRFDELTRTRNDANDEMRRLEGEHRLVVALLQDEPGITDKPKRIRKIPVVDAPAKE